MKNTTLLLSILTASIATAFCQNVSMNEASTVAKAFFISQGKSYARCAKTYGGEDNTLLYIFNAENAFVVISGDKSTVPVLAYVDGMAYSDSDTVAPFNMWMNSYIAQIDHARKNGLYDEERQAAWQELLDGRPFRNGSEVEPLMLSQWDQGEFYNYYCPKDPAGPNGRAVTGCVATALGQLLYHFRFPETGTGQYSYTHDQYGEQSANYGETTYDYNAMCDKPTAINTEISKLIYHCGVGVDMEYGPNGSGMYNHSAAKVLRTYFKFSPETDYLYRDSTDLDWDSVIVSHLHRGTPMYYAGWSVPNINGHGFICDGYKMVDSNYYFHFNFGWGGYMDGYFYTNSLFVGGSNFNLSQELIVNARPDTVNYVYPTPQPTTGSTTLTALQGTFTDGSPTGSNYRPCMDYTWHIKPSSQNIRSITLKADYSLGLGDTISVIDPSNSQTQLFFTAENDNFEIELETDEVIVRFTSDTAFESFGFRMQYITNEEVFCSGMPMFNSPTGSIDDGSGEAQYNNFSLCKYRLMLSGYNAIIFHINYLDLEEGHDFLHFYKNTVNENNRMLSLTGHLEDTTFVLEASRMTIIMESDEAGTADGFSLEYTASHVGIHDFDNTLQVYPNPATNTVSVFSGVPVDLIEIMSADGRTILTLAPRSAKASVDITGLPAGLYLLRTHTEGGVFTRKLLKK